MKKVIVTIIVSGHEVKFTPTKNGKVVSVSTSIPPFSDEEFIHPAKKLLEGCIQAFLTQNNKPSEK